MDHWASLLLFHEQTVDYVEDMLREQLIKAIGASQVERLVFLSCQPSVLEHDLPLLEEAGFKLEELAVIDQFPGTVHVEAVALLVRT